MSRVIERTTCRACGGNWAEVWDVGKYELNDFPENMLKQKHPAAPLVLCRCHPCGLVQLKHTVPPEWMFQEEYWYRSGTNQAMRQHLKDVVEYARELVPVGPDDTVVDIGANDGTLLSYYEGEKTPWRVAYEPAQNLHEQLSKHCNALLRCFFPDPSYKELVKTAIQAKHITSVAMFYDLDDPEAFVAEVKRLLHPEGIWVNQLAYLPSMLRNNAWDSICHEHLCYYGIGTLMPLLLKHDLQVIDAQEVAVNEGSIRLTITHRDSKVPITWDALKRVRDLSVAEEALRLRDTNEPYFALRARAEEQRREIRKFFLGTVLGGHTVDVLGASTKGNTYLQYCGIDTRMVRQAIERAPEKIGRHTVTGIPIVSEAEARARPAKYILCLIWAFRDAVVERERGKWPAGTKLVFALPKLEMVEL